MEPGHQKTKSKFRQIRAHRTPFALAFDHCPSVLFSFLADVDAANVACALCMPKFLATKLYDIKREVPLMAVLAGHYPCVVRNVVFDGRSDDTSMLSKLPSTVTSMRIDDQSSMDLKVSDLPRSLTRLSFFKNFDEDVYLSEFLDVKRAEDWPPLLTDLCLESYGRYLGTMGATILPPALRELTSWRCYQFGELPSSLISLLTNKLRAPFSELPRGLTTLKVERLKEDSAQLEDLPPALTHFTAHGKFSPDPVLQEVNFPASLRVLHLSFLSGWKPSLPERLEELAIENFGDEPLWSFDCPLRLATLTKLKLIGCQFDQPIRTENLPSLQALKVDQSFNQPLVDLPLSLTDLTLGRDHCIESPAYEHPLDALPSSLTRLQIDRDYNHPLDKLPSSLRFLLIKGSFNRTLSHLPPAMIQLWLKGPAFNQPLGRLPASVTDLCVAGCYNQPLDHLPASLTKLGLFLSAFRHPLDRLPQNLHTLCLGFDYQHSSPSYPGVSPPDLEFKVPLDHLPNGLQELHMPKMYSQPLDRLPSGLRLLSFPYKSTFNQPLNHLPDSLTKLHLNGAFNQPFSRLPRGLKDLRFLHADVPFNHPLPLVRPSAGISTRKKMNEEKGEGKVEVTYPTALRSLHLGRSFNQPLSLPPSLTKLTMPDDGAFAKPLPISALPVNLTYLHLPRNYVRNHPQLADIAAVRKRCPFVAIAKHDDSFQIVLSEDYSDDDYY